MHIYEQELKSLVDTLQAAHDEAGKLPSEMGAIRVRVQNNILHMQNFINGTAGLAMVTHGKEDSGPVLSILGSPVEFRKPIEPQDIKPTNIERDKFIDDRDNMYAVFTTLTMDQINSKKNKPGGETVIRAVAKRAGHPDYKDAKINTTFIDAVKKLIKDETEAKNAIDKAAQEIQ